MEVSKDKKIENEEIEVAEPQKVSETTASPVAQEQKTEVAPEIKGTNLAISDGLKNEDTPKDGWDRFGNILKGMGTGLLEGAVDGLAESKLGFVGKMFQGGLAGAGFETQGFKMKKMLAEAYENDNMKKIIGEAENNTSRMIDDEATKYGATDETKTKYKKTDSYKKLKFFQHLKVLSDKYNETGDIKYQKALKKAIKDDGFALEDRVNKDGQTMSYLKDLSGKYADFDLTEENFNRISEHVMNEFGNELTSLFGVTGDRDNIGKNVMADVVTNALDSSLYNSSIDITRDFSTMLQNYGADEQNRYLLFHTWDDINADNKVTKQEKSILIGQMNDLRQKMGLRVDIDEADFTKSTVLIDGKKIPINDFMNNLKQESQIDKDWERHLQAKQDKINFDKAATLAKKIADETKEKEKEKTTQIDNGVNEEENKNQQTHINLRNTYKMNYSELEQEQKTALQDVSVDFEFDIQPYLDGQGNLTKDLKELEELDKLWNKKLQDVKGIKDDKFSSPVKLPLLEAKVEQIEKEKAPLIQQLIALEKQHQGIKDNATKKNESYRHQQMSYIGASDMERSGMGMPSKNLKKEEQQYLDLMKKVDSLNDKIKEFKVQIKEVE